MGNDPQVATQTQQAPATSVSGGESGEQAAGGGASSFTSAGAKPSVGASGQGTPKPTTSASDLAYGGHEPSPRELSDAQKALGIAEDILLNERNRGIDTAPHEYQAALRKLLGALTGLGTDGKAIPDPDRVKMLGHARAELGPAITLYQGTPSNRQWVQTHVLHRLDDKQQLLAYGEAKYRVDHSRIEDGKVEEGGGPREQGAELRVHMKRFNDSLKQVNEQLARHGNEEIEHDLEKLQEGAREPAALEGEAEAAAKGAKEGVKAGAKEGVKEGAHAGGKHAPGGEPVNTNGLSAILEVMNVLMLADVYLTYNDEELRHNLTHVHGLFPGVSSYTELLKAVTEFVGGSIGTVATALAVRAKILGKTEAVNELLHLARHTGHLTSSIVAGIEIIHGVAVLCDDEASAQEKQDAAVDVASGSAWFIGAGLAKVGVAGAGVAGALASTEIVAIYAEFKFAMGLYADALVGINGMWMNQAFNATEGRGQQISHDSTALTKCQMLIASEKDPKKLAALKRIETELAASLGQTIDLFIESCEPKGYGPEAAKYPGAYAILRETFESVGQYRGVRAPGPASAAAKVTLKQMAWALSHAADLIAGQAKNMSLEQVKAAEEAHEKKEARVHAEKEADKQAEAAREKAEWKKKREDSTLGGPRGSSGSS